MNKSLPAVIALMLSLVLVGAGAIMIFQGLDARSQVRESLLAERITTPDDATIPGVPVDSAATAMAQAEIIQEHTLAATEGRTWADMDRDDPQRPFYLSAVSLRTSLMSAYMAFKLSDLVMGLGALFLVVGLGGGAASALTLRQPAPATVVVRDRTEEKITV
jgi:hypothetical protein